MPADIAKRIRNALPKLKLGVGGVEACDLAIECEDQWSKDYAMLMNVTAEAELIEEPYFDAHRWHSDFHDMVAKLFPKEDIQIVDSSTHIKVTSATPKKRVFSKWVKPGTILIKRWAGSAELEIYRATTSDK